MVLRGIWLSAHLQAVPALINRVQNAILNQLLDAFENNFLVLRKGIVSRFLQNEHAF